MNSNNLSQSNQGDVKCATTLGLLLLTKGNSNGNLVQSYLLSKMLLGLGDDIITTFCHLWLCKRYYCNSLFRLSFGKFAGALKRLYFSWDIPFMYKGLIQVNKPSLYIMDEESIKDDDNNSGENNDEE